MGNERNLSIWIIYLFWSGIWVRPVCSFLHVFHFYLANLLYNSFSIWRDGNPLLLICLRDKCKSMDYHNNNDNYMFCKSKLTTAVNKHWNSTHYDCKLLFFMLQIAIMQLCCQLHARDIFFTAWVCNGPTSCYTFFWLTGRPDLQI